MLRHHPFHYVSGPSSHASGSLCRRAKAPHSPAARTVVGSPPLSEGLRRGHMRHPIRKPPPESWYFEATERSTYKTRWNKCDALKLILWRPWLFSGPLHCFSTLLPFCGGTLLNWCMVVSIGAPDTLVSHAWPKVPLLILYVARPSVQYI